MADTIVCPTEGNSDELLTVKNNTTIKIRLFKNNNTPVAGSVLADFTQADFSGYSTVGDATLSFGSITVNGSNQSTMTATGVTWTHNGGATANTIYGHLIYNSVTSKCLKAVLWATPFTINTSGQTITVTVTQLLAGTIT